MILSPVQTGQWAELPYFTGCRYVAYKTGETKQVNIKIMINQIINHLNNQGVCLYSPWWKARVIDLPWSWLSCSWSPGIIVCCAMKHQYYNIPIIISFASAPWSSLDVWLRYSMSRVGTTSTKQLLKVFIWTFPLWTMLTRWLVIIFQIVHIDKSK